ncbi:Nucleoside transporter [Colletotrichum higginsianum IMI 349063]|uniref:Nucleoside transporter n=2 Tax=Colletotrichum higginsianum TaxID=80884 RepID=A0A1B7YQA3_COLHI|nr:Nucleoside transporter [Colletotrichum higginsianum IMI 349063]OBR14225.1 Nucleoside transporter [Colletotrichum higginsianum IMI 349063]TID01433.1 Nucleoside transporter FUN26 [Colletotrichum higginsianum]
MERIRELLGKHRKPDRQEYEPLAEEGRELEGSTLTEGLEEVPFSWTEYIMFAWLGMAMLWAWNMFLAAAPYFQVRFQSDAWISQNFQSAILTVSTLTNLTAMLVLTNIQYAASYPFRINLALLLNCVIFSLLTASTSLALDASPAAYLAFILVMVASSSWATGLIQNGAFAFAASFGRPEYMQALMAGQGVAGVLPPIAQVITVLAVPEKDGAAPDTGGDARTLSSSAFVYFLAAVAVSVSALAAFIPLVRRHNHIVESRMVDHMAESLTSVQEAERAARKVVSPLRLLKKLHWLAGAIFMCFAVAMFFPVFTGKILSVRYPGDEKSPTGSLFRPAAFIPLAFFAWNLGDLSGRMATILPFSLRHRPAALFAVSLVRMGFLPMYLLCNIGGRGAVVSSDFFYLVIVQFLFGLTNGWLGSSCMMAAGEWVEEGEREATGGFMGLCLVAGLTTGSLLSFTAGGI